MEQRKFYDSTYNAQTISHFMSSENQVVKGFNQQKEVLGHLRLMN